MDGTEADMDQAAAQTEETEHIQFPDIPPIPDVQAKAVMADPPWAYDDDLPGPGRGSGSHYDTLHAGSVAGMGPQIRKVTAPSAHLFLWFTNSFTEEAYQVAKAWGFEPKTIITWLKVLDEPEGLPFEREEPVEMKEQIGMGHYVRNCTEHILFCTKGRKATNRNDVPGYFLAERTDHSAKPEKSYRLAEELSDGPHLELFSRQERDGWETWGDEA